MATARSAVARMGRRTELDGVRERSRSRKNAVQRGRARQKPESAPRADEANAETKDAHVPMFYRSTPLRAQRSSMSAVTVLIALETAQRRQEESELEGSCDRNHDRLVKLTVALVRDETGTIVAECPSMPGYVSQGCTQDEALNEIRDAILAHRVRAEQGMPSTVRTVEVEISVA